jgi:hypothetical protein
VLSACTVIPQEKQATMPSAKRNVPAVTSSIPVSDIFALTVTATG